MIKSNPIPTRWVIHKLENNNTKKKLSHCCEGLEAHVRLPSLRTQQRDWESPGDLILKHSEIWSQNFHRNRGNRHSRLGGHKQNLAWTKTQKKGTVAPQETEPKPPASVGGSPAEVWVSRGSSQGWEDWQQLSGKVPFGLNTLGEHH